MADVTTEVVAFPATSRDMLGETSTRALSGCWGLRREAEVAERIDSHAHLADVAGHWFLR